MTDKLSNWRTIEGFGNKYIINSSGVVVSLHISNKPRVITQRVDRAGYLTISLSFKGATSTGFVHRLVAAAFIPNHLNKLEVNHRNGIKTDNRVKNLEWVTHSENVQHAHNLRLIPRTGSTRIIDKCSGEKYSSIREASSKTGIRYSSLRGYLNGHRRNKTCLNYEKSTSID